MRGDFRRAEPALAALSPSSRSFSASRITGVSAAKSDPPFSPLSPGAPAPRAPAGDCSSTRRGGGGGMERTASLEEIRRRPSSGDAVSRRERERADAGSCEQYAFFIL